MEKHPVTDAERRMVKEIIIHIYAVYESIRNGQLEKGEMEKDICDFLQRPIPNLIWQEVKIYHKKQFVDYIDELITFRQFKFYNRLIKIDKS